jgi:hypothetical protein
LLEYLQTTGQPEVEAFFTAYYEAVRELPEPGPVNPEFRDRLYSLHPGKEQADEKNEDGPSEETPVARIRTWPLLTGIAAMVALLSIGIWKWDSSLSHPSPVAKAGKEQPAQIIPGGNKAVLTLAGGQQIVLDSLQNGTLSRQGNSNVLKLSSGKLAYQTEKNTSASGSVYNTITTPKGGQYEVALSDGTRVWLNASSSLRFPSSFTGNDRQVEMTGEVYFEVAQNRDKPFKVKADGFQVQVLGTHFNINAYTDETAFKTTLLEGSVNVHTETGSVLLEPGQQAIVSPAQRSVRVLREADTEEAVAWKNGRLQFNNADIPSIMRQIARWYDVEVSYEGVIPPGHFTGAVPRNSSLAKVLEIFSLSQIHFKIDLEHKKITVVS